jgi:predicted metalloendopeptidase
MSWRTVQLLGASTNSEFRDAIFAFSRQTMQVSRMTTCEKGCLVETTEVFNHLLGSAYVAKYYDVSRSRQVQALIRHIRATLLLSFHWLDWIEFMPRYELLLKVKLFFDPKTLHGSTV